MAKQSNEKARELPLEKEINTSRKSLTETTKILIYLGILLIIFIPVYNHIFDSKVAPLGDNAMYYSLGKSLANGDGYVNSHVIERSPSNHFPPGYPFFIAVIMKVFNDDFTTMNYANGVLYFLSLLLLFFILRRFTNNTILSFIATVSILFNMHLLQYSTWMMSEIPFMFVTLASLLLTIEWNRQNLSFRSPYLFALIIVTAASYYVRAQGIALLGGLVLFLAFRKKWLQLLVSLGGTVLLILPWIYRNSKLGDEAYSTALKLKNYYDPSQGLMEGSDWVHRVWENFSRYINTEILSGIFSYEASNYGPNELGENLSLSGHWVSGLIVFGIMIFAIFRIKEYKWLIAGYLGATFGILLLWPQIWYGTRFMLAIIPLIVFLFFFGFKELIFLGMSKLKSGGPNLDSKILPFFFLLILLINFSSLDDLNKKSKEDYPQGTQNFYQLASWTKENIKDPNAVILCRKPTLFFLYANHFVNDFPKSANPDSTIALLKQIKATHIVFTYDYPVAGFQEVQQKYPEKFPVLVSDQNTNTYLFEFKPDNQPQTDSNLIKK